MFFPSAIIPSLSCNHLGQKGDILSSPEQPFLRRNRNNRKTRRSRGERSIPDQTPHRTALARTMACRLRSGSFRTPDAHLLSRLVHQPIDKISVSIPDQTVYYNPLSGVLRKTVPPSRPRSCPDRQTHDRIDGFSCGDPRRMLFCNR